MDQIIISTSVIASIVVTAGVSWLLFRMLHKRDKGNVAELSKQLDEARESLYKVEAEKASLKIEMERKISDAVSNFYQDNQNKEVEIAELKKQIAIQKAKYIEELQAGKVTSYSEGVQKALEDYKVVCMPFFRYKDGFFSKESCGGYSYRLLVKGIPVFGPAEIIVETRKTFDEEVKKAIINSVNAAVSAIGAELGGLPFEGVPLRISKED